MPDPTTAPPTPEGHPTDTAAFHTLTAADLAPRFPAGRLDLGLAARGDLRWAAVDLTPVVDEARARLDLSPLAAVALGRCLVGAALLQALGTRRVSRLTLEVRGDGPLRQVVAEVDAEGNVRGSIAEPRLSVAGPHGYFPVAEAIGQGRLSVLEEIGGQIHQSQVALVSGDLGDDLTHYLEQSKQVDSAVLLGVLTRPAGIAAAGGLIVEAMPGAAEGAIAAVEANIARLGRELPGVSRLLEERGLAGLSAAVFEGLGPESVEAARELRYRCRCNRDRLGVHLSTLDPADRVDLARPDGTIAADCAFCGTTYVFSREELGAAD
jgi:molecular chaperone Hsp33